MIYLTTYDEFTNPEAVLDTEKSFAEQTEVCKEYIQTKQNASEILPINLDDGYNRASVINYQFTDGFKVCMKQIYDHLPPNSMVINEEVLTITID